MATYTSPNVYYKETDLSQRVQGFATSVCAVVGASNKGTVGERVLVSNTKQFLDIFGNPDVSVSYLHYTALAALETATSLYVTRVVGDNALKSAIKVNQSGSSAGSSATELTTTETLDTGDGSTLEYSGVLLKREIIKSSISITTVVGASPVTITDDGDGNLSGTGVTGEIDYDLGTWDLTFTTAPDNDEDIDISYGYGGVTDPETIDYWTGDTDGLLLIYAENEGVWGDALKISITDIDTDESTFTINVYETVEGTDILRESISGCSRLSGLDGFGQNIYVEDRISENSSYIRVQDNTAVAETVLPEEITTAVSLANGNNGAAVSESDVSTAWDLYTNLDDVTVDVLLNGGYVSSSSFVVQSKIKSICDAREDCIGILDAPSTEVDSASDLVDWRKTTQNFNSSRVALYAPWIKVFDTINNINGIEVPPSGFVGQVIARNDDLAEAWYAPAGLNRALLSSGVLPVLGVSDTYTVADKNLLYSNGINYIISKPGSGIVVWGNKTQQTKASALQSVHIRRLLNVMKREITNTLDSYLFEFNDEFTRNEIFYTLDPYLESIEARRGVYGYTIVCDDTNNTPQVIDNNQLNVDIYIQPARAAEFIRYQAIVTRTNANVSELISTGGNF